MNFAQTLVTLCSQDPTTNSKNLRRSTQIRRSDTQIRRSDGLSFNGFLTHMAYTFFENILSAIVWGIFLLVLGNQLQSFIQLGLDAAANSGVLSTVF